MYRRQTEVSELWRNMAGPAFALQEIGWSGLVEQGASQPQGGVSTGVGTPRPSKCRPAMTKSGSESRVLGTVGSAVIQAAAGPLAALRVRAAPRCPSGVEMSKDSRSLSY